jgi:hypothetical protein
MKTVYKCKECGSTNVEVKSWVNPNNPKEWEPFDWCNESTWCIDCQKHAGIDIEE